MFTSDILSFDEEAFKDIKKTIPLGNSHIGALVYGNVSNEILPLNENTFWVYGTEAKIKKREFYKHIKNVENLIEEDNILEANKYAIENIDSNIGRRALYKTASFLNINYHSGKNISSYNRTLDMGSGEIYVSYIENKHKIERKYFSSIVDDLICVNIESTKIEEIDLSLSNNDFQNQIKDYQNSIVMITKFNGYQELYTSVKVEANIIKVSNNKIHARGKSISIYIKLATSYYKPNPRHYILSSLAKKYDLKNINEAAVSKYKSLYYTQSIHTNNYNINNTYNFSRYIMISSSLYNLPMTRNGIWSFNNDDTYNLGAFLTNYSNCFGGNLKDCINPLFDFLKLIHKTGKSPARKMYKARGSFSFNNFDMFGNTFLKGDNLNISYNPLGQTNLVPFIIDYYRYSNDLNFVKHYYSLIKDNVDFVISNLKKDKNNKYVFYPSTSIGDTFKIDNELCYISDGCTSDDIFIYELMYDFILINRDLGYDEAINKPYVDIILNMHHIGINNKNYIMPYHSDYKVARPSYTLLTHVTNVFSKDYKPTSVVTDANKNTILKMEDYKNDGSLRASLTHFYANLGMKKEFYESFNKFIDNNVSDSLLSLDSDVNLMGNFQIGKAIHDAFIIPKFFKLYLNQSLPKDITNYSLKGFPVYNNIVVDLIKTDNEFVMIATTDKDKEFVINYKSKDYYVNLKTGSNRIDLNELFNLN